MTIIDIHLKQVDWNTTDIDGGPAKLADPSDEFTPPYIFKVIDKLGTDNMGYAIFDNGVPSELTMRLGYTYYNGQSTLPKSVLKYWAIF